MSEVPQTGDIPIPRSEGAMRTFEEVRFKSDWMKSFGQRLGVDIPKWQLGYVLETIEHDDSSCFEWEKYGVYSTDDALFAQSARENKENILARLSWEVTIPELPDDLRTRLTTAREELSNLDFTNRARFSQARNEWQQAKSMVTEAVKKQSKLRQAKKYCWDIQNDPKVQEAFSVYRQSVDL